MSAISPLVTIPDCTATHVLSTRSVNASEDLQTVADLGAGALTLVLASADAIAGPVPGLDAPDLADIKVICTLAVANAAFALYQSTLFGTLDGESNVYVFKPEIGGDKGSYIKITLPAGVKEPGSELARLQERFEEILIKYGLLKDGVEAIGDELGRGIREDAADAAAALRGAATQYTRENPATTSPTQFSETTHSITGGAAHYTGAAASLAGRASSVITSAMQTGGAKLATSLSSLHTPASAAALNSASSAYTSATTGVSAGASELRASIAESTRAVTEHEYGREAADVSDNVTGSVGNVGRMAGSVAGVATVAGLAGEGLKGAASVRAVQDRQMLDKEMRTAAHAAEVGRPVEMHDGGMDTVELQPVGVAGGPPAKVDVDQAWKSMSVAI